MKEKVVKAKRVDIVPVQLVKEKSFSYSNHKVESPQDEAELLREFLGKVDRVSSFSSNMSKYKE